MLSLLQRTFIFLGVILLLCNGIVAVNAQEDVCQPEVVVRSFAEAIATGNIENWERGYVEGSCPGSVIQGARALVSLLQSMQQATSPLPAPDAALPELTTGGEYPTVQFSDALGRGGTIEVARVQRYDDTRCIPMPGVALEVVPGVFVTAPVTAVRQIRQVGDQHSVLYIDGQEIAGRIDFTLTGADDTGYDMTAISQMSLLSIPDAEDSAGSSAEEAPDFWQLEITGLNLSFTVDSPDFRYRWVNCNTTVLGGSPYGSTRSFTFSFNEQELKVNLTDFVTIAHLEGETTVTTPGGQSTTGSLAVGNDRDTTTSRYFLRANLGGERQIWVDSSAGFVLARTGG